jgi:glycerate dehydrogenase
MSRNGRWQRSISSAFFDHPIRDLFGATLGIIGEGVLGQGTAKIARLRHEGAVRRSCTAQDAGSEFTPLDRFSPKAT